MAFLAKTRKVANQIVNVRVHEWINLRYLKTSSSYVKDAVKRVFTIQQAAQTESFAESIQRLNISEIDVKNRYHEFSRLFMIFLVFTILIFIYTMFITIQYKSGRAFIIGTSVTILSLVKTCRYHFWLTQIKKRKLGLTIKEWLS